MLEAAQAELTSGRLIEARLLELPASELLTHFGLPSLSFHLSRAYTLMRQAGLALSKQDFDSLPDYRCPIIPGSTEYRPPRPSSAGALTPPASHP